MEDVRAEVAILSKKHPKYLVEVKNDILRVEHIGGRRLTRKEVNMAVAKVLLDDEKVERYQRKNRFRFVYQLKRGLKAAFIELEKMPGLPEKRPLFTEGKHEKCESIICFVYDFLDLCVADGFLDIADLAWASGRHSSYYRCHSQDKYTGIRVKRYRDTTAEPGWNEPNGEIHRAEIVY